MKKYIVTVIIAILCLIILLQRCGHSPVSSVRKVVSVRIDTVWLTRDRIIYRSRVHQSPIAHTPPPPPDTTLASLTAQYTALAAAYYTVNVAEDTLYLDSGYVSIFDTLQQNRLLSRTYYAHWVTPVVSTTTTSVLPPNRQLYIGGGLTASYAGYSRINNIELGIIYKDRKDRMFGIGANTDFSGHIGYSVYSYWKIRAKQ